jgi:uncharacterized protein
MIITKQVSAPASLKLADPGLDDQVEGRFSGYASVFDIIDDQGDRVERGAFARSLQNSTAHGRRPALLWQHDQAEPIGVWERVEEDARGLSCIGRLCLATRRGAEAHALMKQGALTGLSIGYRARTAVRDSKTGVRRLVDVDLLEISPVTFPALGAARIAAVKGVDPEGLDALSRAIATAFNNMRTS